MVSWMTLDDFECMILDEKLRLFIQIIECVGIA